MTEIIQSIIGGVVKFLVALDFVEIVETLVATCVGGYITILLTRKQESRKINKSLKIDVYRKYIEIYNNSDVFEKIQSLYTRYDALAGVYKTVLLHEDDSDLSIIKKIEEFTSYAKDTTYVGFFEQTKEVERLMNRIKNYLGRELDILEYNKNPYKQVHYKISELSKRLSTLDSIGNDIVNFYKYKHENNISDDDKVNYNFDSERGEYDFRIRERKTIEQLKSQYNSNLEYLAQTTNLFIQDTSYYITIIDKKIKEDIVGEYFEIKPWNLKLELNEGCHNFYSEDIDYEDIDFFIDDEDIDFFIDDEDIDDKDI